MPTRIEIDGSLVIATCEGEFTLQDAIELTKRIGTDPAMPDRVQLLVHDKSTTFDASTEGLEELAAAYGKIIERISGRWAIVVGKTYHYGLGRMFSVFGERFGLTTRVCKSIEEAKNWLAHGDDGDQDQ